MMERRKFDNWLNARQNITEDNMVTRFFKRNRPQSASVNGNELEEPSQIYTHPVVNKYYQEVIGHLLLNRPLEIIDGSGHKKGDYNGQPNDEIEKTLKRFIASPVIGGSKSFLRVNQHDAILILNYLDRLRVPGEDLPLTDRFGINNPASLSHWIETHVSAAPDFVKQLGFGQASNAYVAPRDLVRTNSLHDPRVKKLADASVRVINGIHGKMETSGRRITKDIIDAVRDMRNALEEMKVLEPEAASPTSNSVPNQDPDPDIVGRGRGKPKNP